MKRTKTMLLAAVATLCLCGCVGTVSDDASGFVVLTDEAPDILVDARYYGTFNFIGERMPGYEEPIVLLTREAARALKAVNEDLKKQGYRLKVYDGYRPQQAVDRFVEWAKDADDVRMKRYFYPEMEKRDVIPQGYIFVKSGHTRGSTVDLTLFNMKDQCDADMGCTFDYFGRASNSSVLPGEKIGPVPPLSREQYERRQLLRRTMMAHGFVPLESEWWHFSLENEPYPETYFNFPVSRSSL